MSIDYVHNYFTPTFYDPDDRLVNIQQKTYTYIRTKYTKEKEKTQAKVEIRNNEIIAPMCTEQHYSTWLGLVGKFPSCTSIYIFSLLSLGIIPPTPTRKQDRF